MNILKELSCQFYQLFKTEVDMRSISKAKLLEDIADNKDFHKEFVEAMRTFSNKDLAKMKSTFDARIKETSYSRETKKIVSIYEDGLISKAKEEEIKNPFRSLIIANEIFIDILTDIQKNIDKVFENRKAGEGIEVKEIRVNEATFLGIIHASETFAKFSIYYYSFIMSVIRGEAIPVPVYRQKFLYKTASRAASISNQILAQSGAFNFLKFAKKIKVSSANVNLFVSGKTGGNYLNGVSIGAFTPFLQALLGVLNIYAMSKRKYEEYKNNKYQERVNLVEWLKLNVSVSKMELENIDKKDPEYRRKLKIISNLEMQINEHEKLINEYLEEE